MKEEKLFCCQLYRQWKRHMYSNQKNKREEKELLKEFNGIIILLMVSNDMRTSFNKEEFAR